MNYNQCLRAYLPAFRHPPPITTNILVADIRPKVQFYAVASWPDSYKDRIRKTYQYIGITQAMQHQQPLGKFSLVCHHLTVVN